MPFTLNASDCTFILIDVQESLFRFIHDNKTIEMNMKLLLRLREILNIPLVVTVQNGTKLGSTLPSLVKLLPDDQKEINKLVFSCLKVPEVVNDLESINRKTLVLFGIESHICVYQTSIDALSKDYNVVVVTDAVSSRTSENKTTGLNQMRKSGANLLSTEMVIYELLGEAGTTNFRAMLPFLKDPNSA